MPADLADVVATSPTTADVVITLSSGTINNPPTLDDGTALTYTGTTITVPAGKWPKGDNSINVPIVFAPGEDDAHISATGADAKVNGDRWLPANETPGAIDIFGK
jgi:hypothetical protein